MFMVGVSHLEATPAQLAALARHVDAVAQHLRTTAALPGFAILATCNRFEVYADAATFHGPVALLLDAIDGAAPATAAELSEAFYVTSGPDLVEHLYRVTAGLESMVIGEAEVVGQVRQALAAPGNCVSPALRRLFDDALAFSKSVTTTTTLREVGRTHASVGLDLAEPSLPPWPEVRAVIAGTGQYAGTVVAELRRRGCVGLSVYSASGNADQFAATHPVTPVAELAPALPGAQLFVAASGQGGTKVRAEELATA
ncbi:MAG: glutamyl-tRNA reductase, partial [Promicromonosporaceae bacterium]|nr:glutamyl-tRNA reductase [Promicromonosporaceae bacterium]